MKLTKAEITNFRSIKDLTINFDKSCRILVGINESGKSNILKALALLSNNKITTNDRRFILADEEQFTEAQVSFIFTLTDLELNALYENISEIILSTNPQVTVEVKPENNKISLSEFCKHRSTGIYEIDLIEGKRTFKYYTLPKNTYSLVGKWYQVNKATPPTELIQVGEDKYALKDYALVDENYAKNIDPNYLTTATADDLNKIIGNELTSIIENNLPECIFWEYKEQNILPSSISISAFSQNPDSCVPLKNMFELANFKDIKKAFDDADTQLKLRNLLAKVASITTKHIREVWKEKEYESVEILLEPNGQNIDASVRNDFNRYEFTNRSDGFKRFVSFLILISSKVRTNQLDNTLILIDEPEIGLHPSGARYLRDELLKISNKNTVVYSTHSIFMIDRDDIERHLIVKKDKEITSVTEDIKSTFADEEVIYNALNHSIFENLKEKNLIFEGWRDKKLFQLAIENNEALKNSFSNIGITHLQGVSDAARICPILELGKRSYLIVSDSDAPARSAQSKFAGTGTWKRWDEISSKKEIVTGEDFLTHAYIIKILSELKSEYPAIQGLSLDTLNLESSGGLLYRVSEWIGSLMDKSTRKNFESHLKDELKKSMTLSDIDAVFYEYLNELSKILNP